MDSLLGVDQKPLTEERITKVEYHAHQPYTPSLKFGDEVRILIQQQDLYVKPSDSYFLVRVEITKKTAGDLSPDLRIYNNGWMFIFDEIRYEINGVEIDRCRNVGLTSTMKQYATNVRSDSEMTVREDADDDKAFRDFFVDYGGGWQFFFPMRYVLGFCEDYKKIVINARHELILRLSRDFKRVGNFAADEELHVRKIDWYVPQYHLNDREKLRMINILDSGQFLTMPYRSWELFELPFVAQTTKFSWNIKTSSSLERPRYVIFGLQTGRSNPVKKNSGLFDSCNLRNLKVYLNSESYPYENFDVDFTVRRMWMLYKMYVDFRRSYYSLYDQPHTGSVLPSSKFSARLPLVCIDVSRQNDAIKSGPVDVRLEFELGANAPPGTQAVCLLIHDRIVEYSPLTNITRHLV